MSEVIKWNQTKPGVYYDPVTDEIVLVRKAIGNIKAYALETEDGINLYIKFQVFPYCVRLGDL